MKKTELSITQSEVIDFALESLHKNKQVYLDLEVGFGKTLTALNLLGEIIGEENKKILYICPSGLIPQVSKVVEKNFPNFKIDFKAFGWFQNLEFLKTQLDLSSSYDLVVVDEAHKIKSYSNSIMCQSEYDLDYFINLQKYKQAKFPYTLVSIGTLAFIKNIKYRIFMSGTPMPLGAIDIFNFLWLMKHPKFISNIFSRQESFFNFCNKYCIKKQSPQGVSFTGFKGLKDQSEKSAYVQLMKNLSDCYIKRKHSDEKSKHLRIPEPIYKIIDIETDEVHEERRIIEILQKHYNITPENFYQILKTSPQFAQMMSVRRAVGISKIKNILKHEKKVGKKAIYFFQFRESAQIFFNEISKKNKNCYLITGELSKNKTAKIIEYTNDLEECLLIATMGKAGTGFDCYGFNTIAFCELDMNLAIVEQARGRIMRKGIKHVPKVFFFLSPGGVDDILV